MKTLQKRAKEWFGLAGELTETGCVPTAWDRAYLRARQAEADAVYQAFLERVRLRERRLRFWCRFIALSLLVLSGLFWGGNG